MNTCLIATAIAAATATAAATAAAAAAAVTAAAAAAIGQGYERSGLVPGPQKPPRQEAHGHGSFFFLFFDGKVARPCCY